MSDSAEIDEALVGKLLGDATLAALMPDGIYRDIGGKSKTRFVIVTLMSALDTGEFGSRAFESPVYLVKAVEFGMSGLNADNAAARIDVLLDDGTLTITGYTLMKIHRIERVRYTEVAEDSDARWQHSGGMYQIEAAPS
jgi:hypothetical protein